MPMLRSHTILQIGVSEVAFISCHEQLKHKWPLLKHTLYSMQNRKQITITKVSIVLSALSIM